MGLSVEPQQNPKWAPLTLIYNLPNLQLVYLAFARRW